VPFWFPTLKRVVVKLALKEELPADCPLTYKVAVWFFRQTAMWVHEFSGTAEPAEMEMVLE
jgi:hypothetical protein